MRIPRKVFLRGQWWTVKLVKGYEKATGYLGLCQRDTRTIIVDADQTRDEQEVAFLHEVLHAIWPDKLTTDVKEEHIIEAIDVDLHNALTKNKL